MMEQKKALKIKVTNQKDAKYVPNECKVKLPEDKRYYQYTCIDEAFLLPLLFFMQYKKRLCLQFVFANKSHYLKQSQILLSYVDFITYFTMLATPLFLNYYTIYFLV